MTDKDPIEVATRALAHRDRSRHELDERLARAGFDNDARTQALARLEQLGYVDDVRFAALRAKTLAGRGYGDDGIRYDLRGHALDRETIEAALAGLLPERERAASLVAELGRSPRVARQLVRKGFASEAVRSALAG